MSDKLSQQIASIGANNIGRFTRSNSSSRDVRPATGGPMSIGDEPEQCQQAFTAEDWAKKSETLAAYIQLTVNLLLMLIFAVSPAPVDRQTTLQSDTTIFLVVLVLLATLRCALPRRYESLGVIMGALAIADIAVLSAVVYSFHLQYQIPLAAVLKAPAFGYFFLYIALRAVSLRNVNVIVTGLCASLAWGMLTYIAALQTPPSGGFTQYVTSSSLLVGAEMERCFILLLVTAVMALGVSRAQQLVKQMVNLSDSAKHAEIEEARFKQFREISANVAHKMRSPLSAIYVSSGIIEKKSKANGLDLEKPARRILSSVERCESVIDTLIQFTDNVKEIETDITLDQWLESVVRAQAAKMPDEIGLECHLGLDDFRAKFDTNMMSKTIANLISNAVDAITGSGQIVVTSKHLEEGIAIIISDNGCGMPEGQIEQMCQPLQTTKHFEVGLGLPIAIRAVEAHGGELIIDSQPGQGTSVTIQLPA